MQSFTLLLDSYATTLYLQAIGILMKPSNGTSGASTSVEDRCRAAQIMNNLSDLMSQANPKAAESWARQAQSVVHKTRELPGSLQDSEAMALCEHTLAAAMFNLGMLLEVRAFVLMALLGVITDGNASSL